MKRENKVVTKLLIYYFIISCLCFEWGKANFVSLKYNTQGWK